MNAEQWGARRAVSSPRRRRGDVTRVVLPGDGQRNARFNKAREAAP